MYELALECKAIRLSTLDCTTHLAMPCMPLCALKLLMSVVLSYVRNTDMRAVDCAMILARSTQCFCRYIHQFYFEIFDCVLVLFLSSMVVVVNRL